MNSNYKTRTLFTIFVVIACAPLSITKGWLLFLAVPAYVLLTPMVIIATVMVNSRQKKYGLDPLLMKISWLLPISMLATYIFLPGVGDTSNSVVFGLFMSDNSTLLAISFIMFVVVALLFLLSLILAMAMSKAKSPAPTGHTKLLE